MRTLIIFALAFAIGLGTLGRLDHFHTQFATHGAKQFERIHTGFTFHNVHVDFHNLDLFIETAA
jgi:hypothetical protein